MRTETDSTNRPRFPILELSDTECKIIMFTMFKELKDETANMEKKISSLSRLHFSTRGPGPPGGGGGEQPETQPTLQDQVNSQEHGQGLERRGQCSQQVWG